MQNNLKKTTIKPTPPTTTTTPLQSRNIGDKFWNDLYLCMDTMFALLFGTTTTTTMKTWPNPKSNFCCFSLFYLTPPPTSTIEKKLYLWIPGTQVFFYSSNIKDHHHHHIIIIINRKKCRSNTRTEHQKTHIYNNNNKRTGSCAIQDPLFF